MKQVDWRRNLLLALLVSGGFLLLANLTITFSFETNDDVAMISILNGCYTGTPDAHAIFIGYPLSWLISKCYSTGISICWYKWVMLGICLFAIVSLLYRLLERFPKHPILVSCAAVGSISAIWLKWIMRLTFTTCGGFVTAIVLLCFVLQPKEKDLKPGYLANILLLYLLSYQLRDYFGYLTTAFLGVIWLYKYGKEMFSQKKCWLIPLAALICLGASVGIQKWAYRDWGDYFTYNDERVYLQDYSHFPSYDGHEEALQALGYDRAEYFTVSHYDYCMLEEFSPENIHQLYEYAKSLEAPSTPAQTIRNTFNRTAKFLLIENVENITVLEVLSLALPLLMVAAAVVLTVRDRNNYLTFPVLLIFGLACSWLVIAYRGRFPNRVEVSLRLLNISAALAGLTILFSQRPVRLTKQKVQRWISAGLCVLFLAGGAWGWRSAKQLQTSFGKNRDQYISYAAKHPENIYIRDTRSTMGSYQIQKEFPRITVNVLSTGGWTVYTPLYYEKLEALGLEEVNRETLFRDDVYFVLRVSKSDINQALGLNADAVVDYTVVEQLKGGIQILKINDIIYPK